MAMRGVGCGLDKTASDGAELITGLLLRSLHTMLLLSNRPQLSS